MEYVYVEKKRKPKPVSGLYLLILASIALVLAAWVILSNPSSALLLLGGLR